MEDNNKLFVFEKKEVILIFIFITLISVISFTLGVRTGKQLSLKHDDFSSGDISNINLKSVVEESTEAIVTQEESSQFEDSMSDSKAFSKSEKRGTNDQMEERLREEMAKLANENVSENKVKSREVSKVLPRSNARDDIQVSAKKEPGSHVGKYTIQLFSHQSKEMAQDFADGFILKGYDIIINEVIIPGKGKWYRVGVGLYDNVNEAKDYLEKEKKLFQSKKYLIQQI